jgi:transketolase C-terminal domain/subunit
MEPFSNHQDPLYLLFQGKRHKITKAAESEQRGRPRPMVSDPGHSKSSSKLQMAVKAFPTRLLNPGLPEPKCLMGTAAVDLTGIGIDRARTWQCYTCGFHTRIFFFQIFF